MTLGCRMEKSWVTAPDPRAFNQGSCKAFCLHVGEVKTCCVAGKTVTAASRDMPLILFLFMTQGASVKARNILGVNFWLKMYLKPLTQDISPSVQTGTSRKVTSQSSQNSSWWLWFYTGVPSTSGHSFCSSYKTCPFEDVSCWWLPCVCFCVRKAL